MINLFSRQNKREEEEKKARAQDEEMKGDEGTTQAPAKTKRSPGLIRLQKEVGELDLPRHVEITFPDPDNIMKFHAKVDLSKEDCLWKGATYHFTVTVPPNYPHDPPKAHCDT